MSALARKEEIAQARAVASQIRQGIHNYLSTLGLIARANRERHWQVLGYSDWQTYVDGEFGAERLKLPTEHRQKAVSELRLSGMSTTAIATVVGISRNTVAKDLAQSEQPDEIIGRDGKTYQTPARRDLAPSSIPEPEVIPAGEPDQLEEVAPAAGGREGGAASSTELPAGPRNLVAEGPSPDRPGLDDPYSIEARRESERRAAVANLRSVLTYLVSTSVSPSDLAERDYGVALDEFKQDDLDFAASTMRAIAELKGK